MPKRLTACITLEGSEFKAALSDGRTLFASDMPELATKLVVAGIAVEDTYCGDSKIDGDLAPMIGQAIALKVEMRRLVSTVPEPADR